MKLLTSQDRPAVALTAVVSVPVSVGLLTAAAAAPQTSDAVVIAALLIFWLVTALPIAVMTCRAVPKHIPTGPPPSPSEDCS